MSEQEMGKRKNKESNKGRDVKEKTNKREIEKEM